MVKLHCNTLRASELLFCFCFIRLTLLQLLAEVCVFSREIPHLLLQHRLLFFVLHAEISDLGLQCLDALLLVGYRLLQTLARLGHGPDVLNEGIDDLSLVLRLLSEHLELRSVRRRRSTLCLRSDLRKLVGQLGVGFHLVG